MKISSKHALLLAILTIGSMGTGLANDTDHGKQPEQQSSVQKAWECVKNHKGKIIAAVGTVAAIGLGYWYRDNISNFLGFNSLNPNQQYTTNEIYHHVRDINDLEKLQLKITDNYNEQVELGHAIANKINNYNESKTKNLFETIMGKFRKNYKHGWYIINSEYPCFNHEPYKTLCNAELQKLNKLEQEKQELQIQYWNLADHHMPDRFTSLDIDKNGFGTHTKNDPHCWPKEDIQFRQAEIRKNLEKTSNKKSI